jgi:hypothetical protein
MLGEALGDEELGDYFGAMAGIEQVVHWYKEVRLHSALGFLRPMDYYRGQPAQLRETRRQKLAAARHRRSEPNLRSRQPMLPLKPVETVA